MTTFKTSTPTNVPANTKMTIKMITRLNIKQKNMSISRNNSTPLKPKDQKSSTNQARSCTKRWPESVGLRVKCRITASVWIVRAGISTVNMTRFVKLIWTRRKQLINRISISILEWRRWRSRWRRRRWSRSWHSNVHKRSNARDCLHNPIN